MKLSVLGIRTDTHTHKAKPIQPIALRTVMTFGRVWSGRPVTVTNLPIVLANILKVRLNSGGKKDPCRVIYGSESCSGRVQLWVAGWSLVTLAQAYPSHHMHARHRHVFSASHILNSTHDTCTYIQTTDIKYSI